MSLIVSATLGGGIINQAWLINILHVLAKKAMINVDAFQEIEKSVYTMKYLFNGKVRN